MRIGFGVDSHRFDAAGAGGITLGGVTIPYERTLQGHSDADVVLHALTDALLGAIAAPDLGELFPPTDARWRGAASRLFVEEAMRRVDAGGWAVANVDITVVTDAPKLTPHKPALRASISRLIAVDESVVSVKAKTTEGLPPAGDGIVAYAAVLLSKRNAA